jgi:hypothetical protein
MSKRRSLLITSLLVLAAPLSASAAEGPVITDLPEVEFNSVCAMPGDVQPPPCDGADVTKEVGAAQAEWLPNPDSIEYRFFVCPTHDFEFVRCTDRSGWLVADGLARAAFTYPPQDAGAWAVVQARAFYGGDATTPTASIGRQLASPPALAAGLGYRIVGALPDGSVRPGMAIDVKPVDPFPNPVANGSPPAELSEYWAASSRSLAVNNPPSFGGPTSSFVPHNGKLVVGRVDSLAFVLQAKNPAGLVFRTFSVPVRREPHRLVTVAIQKVTARVGRRLRYSPGSALPAEPFAGMPRPVLSHRWRRCTVRSCVDIKGAAGTSYTPTARDRSHRLRLVLVGSNSEGKGRLDLLETGVVGARRPAN